ncbi:rhomboid family intramembrane serine protease [Campylobacter coli]
MLFLIKVVQRVFLLMSFAPLLMGVNVAWYGHIFGFICGYFLGKLRRKI